MISLEAYKTAHQTTESLRLSPNATQLAVFEMQLPTRLLERVFDSQIFDYSTYQAHPPWQDQVVQAEQSPQEAAKRTMKNLSVMPGRNDKRWGVRAYTLYDQASNIFAHLDQEDVRQIEKFRDAKRKMFRDMSIFYLPFMRVLRSTGLLAKTGFDQSQKFEPTGDINWRIVSEHSLVAAKVAEVLASAMVNQLTVDKAAREHVNIESLNTDELALFRSQAITEVVAGVLLQDATKKQEIDFKRLKQDEKTSAIQMLIHEGFGSPEDMTFVQENVQKADGVYERLLQEKTKKAYEEKWGEQFAPYGNIETIMNCAKSAGMPVISFPQDESGHYLPTLAQRIANMADKLVQDTGIVGSIDERHQEVRMRYTPVESVDMEYEYARRCAEEFKQIMPFLQYMGENALPQFVLGILFSEITSYKGLTNNEIIVKMNELRKR